MGLQRMFSTKNVAEVQNHDAETNNVEGSKYGEEESFSLVKSLTGL